MYAKIEIEVEEEKDGGLTLKFNGMKLGDLDDLKPIDEINQVHDLVKVREETMRCNKLVNDLNKEIVYRLAKLLAWYYTE